MTDPEGNSEFCFPRRSWTRIIFSFGSYALVYAACGLELSARLHGLHVEYIKLCKGK